MAAGLTLLSNVALTSCGDDDIADANDVLAVKSVLPVKVMEGQVVTITGTGLEKADAVVFPGDVRVTDITKVGNGYITVVTPAGVPAEGGAVAVEADGEKVYSAYDLSVGAPAPARVAPVDAEVKVNECVEVYGTDLEFITKAYFPGADGNAIVVDARYFKRKSTSALFIYSPAGVAAGPAAITIEDCSGKQYVLPEITLSDEISGGSTEGDAGVAVWEGSFQITSWNWFEPTPDAFDYSVLKPAVGREVRFYFEGNTDTSRFCFCYGDWSGDYDLGGEGDKNNVGIPSDVNYISLVMDEKMVDNFLNGNPVFHVSGTDFTITKIVFMPMPLYQGEHESGWWWYVSPDELYFDDSVIEPGRHLKFTFREHDNPQTFCLCDGWWGVFDLGGSPDINNVAIPGGVTEITCEITENCATIMNTREATSLIIGGEVVILKIEVID